MSDRLRGLAQEGVRCVVLAPIGFVSDHMEVVSDLDTDAVAAGEAVGVEVIRVPTVGTDPGWSAIWWPSWPIERAGPRARCAGSHDPGR